MSEKRLIIEIDERMRINIQHTTPEKYGKKGRDGWQEVEPKKQQGILCSIFNIDKQEALDGLTELLRAVISKEDDYKHVEHLLEKIEANI